MSGSSGKTSTYQASGANQGAAASNAFAQLQANPQIASLLSQYGSGGMSYQDAMKAAGSMGSADTSGIDSQLAALQAQSNAVGNNGDLDDSSRQSQLGQIGDQIATLTAQKADMASMSPQAAGAALVLDPTTGSKFASDQVMNNKMYAGLFGDSGSLGQSQQNYANSSNNLNTDRNSLMGRDSSYGLQDSDLQAYGTASGNITSMFGQQAQNLSNNLASRGLGAGDSGGGQQAFSNLYGNQLEQLAGLQQNIAQNRIQTAQGLAQARTNADLQEQAQSGNLALNLGQLANSAESNQYSQDLSGITTQAGLQNNNATLNAALQAQAQNTSNESFAQQQATSTPSLGQSIVSGAVAGAGSSAGQIAASPGTSTTALAKMPSTIGGGGGGGAAAAIF